MRAGVVGSPVGHSLSPAMHRAAYAALGLDWTYEATEVAEGDLAVTVAGLDGSWRGLSVTAPLKREAARLAGRCDDVVAELGVANTLIRDEDAVSGWAAANTDVPGAVAALAELPVTAVTTVRVVGGGATAASMVRAVSMLGAREIELVVRDVSRAAAAAAVGERAGARVRFSALADLAGSAHRPDRSAPDDRVDLLVSTVPAAALTGLETGLAERAVAVFDVVYDPWPSALVAAATARGRPAATGLDLLAHQAALQVELMTGRPVAPEELHAAALVVLAP